MLILELMADRKYMWIVRSVNTIQLKIIATQLNYSNQENKL